MTKYSTRRSDQEWLQVITECRQSGLPDSTWCEQHGIKPSTFYNALNRLREKACTIPQSTKTTYALDLTSHQDVVRVDLCSDSYPKTVMPVNTRKAALYLDNSYTIEIVVDNIRMKIGNSADPALLTNILHTLRHSSC